MSRHRARGGKQTVATCLWFSFLDIKKKKGMWPWMERSEGYFNKCISTDSLLGVEFKLLQTLLCSLLLLAEFVFANYPLTGPPPAT